MYVYILCIYTHFVYILHMYVWQMGENTIGPVDCVGSGAQTQGGLRPGSPKAASQCWALQRAVVLGSWAGNRRLPECRREGTRLQVGWAGVGGSAGEAECPQGGAGRGVRFREPWRLRLEEAEHGCSPSDPHGAAMADGWRDWPGLRHKSGSCSFEPSDRTLLIQLVSQIPRGRNYD